ncbi:hypothetical protein DOM22_05375 [Bdellovibrio sp. ZAP7]|uniref:DUF1156 domain-containing protein n=1 Tax=Bdellovibrio sp. ZAP7 TaxID=2231053 RepID=UPI00115C1A44|nr:DUF1156 domain-containing protein [Bdellovibrio sp. ZAP7]QDK44632.1 hypothetical protein DOM22_05375 [Bdellovibrio sp. ZAP7]
MKPIYRKKLIEVAMPLEAINVAAAREKSIRHGHPSTLHLWWARRPLAAARAVIFASLVDDPSCDPRFRTDAERNKERKRLFGIIADLVKWENLQNEKVINAAKLEIKRTWESICEERKLDANAAEFFNPHKLPALHDPFAGGGAIPLESQRLGLETYASDLNPVAVLINKAMVEIPPRFASLPPVCPVEEESILFAKEWVGSSGLSEDIRRYGAWVKEEAWKAVGDLFPKITLTPSMCKERPDLKALKAKELKVIAWIWARTVKSPNPAFSQVYVPLVSTFVLANKPGKEAWIQPLVKGSKYSLEIQLGKPPVKAKNGTKLSRGANFECILSGTPIESKYIYSEAKANRMGSKLLAVVAEGPRGRIYLPPSKEAEDIAASASPKWRPDLEMPENPRSFSPPLYGLNTYGDIFTDRQLVVLESISSLIQKVIKKAKIDAIKAGLSDDGISLEDGGSGATAYGEAIAVYLTFALSRSADRGSTICTWDSSPKMEALRNTFGRQAIPMTWDFAEGNPFSDSSGNWMNNIDWVAKAVLNLPAAASGHTIQKDAGNQNLSKGKVISCDPPYYDNIPYADLSDFFYVWLRRTLRNVFPTLFTTIATPKAEELVATRYRHGSKEAAETFFLEGMTDALKNISSQAHPEFPVTIYYAFKQSETEQDGSASTGWETFLEALMRAGLSIGGTWPMRTELSNRMIGKDANALASSIVLVCRRRDPNAVSISRREYVAQLRRELPQAVQHLRRSGIAAVDLAQSAIGPGMAVFTRFKRVLEADDKPMSVRAALILINDALDEILAESDSQLDSYSRWAVAWFEQNGFKVGLFDDANKLAQAKNIGVEAIASAGIVTSKSGKVALVERSKFKDDWYPDPKKPVSHWFAMQQLIKRLDEGGEQEAGVLLRNLGPMASSCLDLAYRCFAICEKRQWAQEAIAYNSLVASWSSISAYAMDQGNLSQGILNIE